jgi:biopolymer transport protein ExbB/TolQ
MVTKLFNAFTALGPEWIMYLLAILSVVSIAIICERWTTLRKQERAGKDLWGKHAQKWMEEGVGKDWVKDAEKLSLMFPCVEGELLRVLSKTNLGKLDGTKVADSFLIQSRHQLERFTGFLGTVGSNAPFIGLLGTVIGIIRAFHGLAGGMEGAAQNISEGIAEALVSTAIGLLVAIPAVIAFNMLTARVDKIMGRAQSLGQLILAEKNKV